MTNKEIYDLTKYLFESWERGADYDSYHMDCQYVLDALVMPEEERWLLYKSPAQRKPLTDEQVNLFINGRGDEDDEDYVEPTGDGFGLTDADLVRLVRRVEAAHDIKEST